MGIKQDLQRRFQLLMLARARFIAVLWASAMCVVSCSDQGSEQRGSVIVPEGFAVASALFSEGPELLRAMNAAERDTASCVHAEGWEYTPADQSVYFSPARYRTTENAEQIAKQFGYEQAVAYVTQPSIPDPMRDPNQTYAARLGEQYSTYWSLVESCKSEALDEYNRIRLELRAAYVTEVSDRVTANPRVADSTQSWATCMRKSGYVYTDLRMPETASALAFETWARVRSVGGELPSFEQLPNEARQSISVLATAETVLAVVDANCWAKSVGLVEEELRSELDAEFILRHAEEMTALARYWVSEG